MAMTGLHITYGPDDVVSVTGTEEQIERLFTLAIQGVHMNVNCEHPFRRAENEQELNDLRFIHKEWFSV